MKSIARTTLSTLLVGLWLAGCATHAEPPTPAQTAQRARAQAAEALFQARCQTAGEKILRTADHVDGVFLMKVRPKEINFGNQFVMDDPYGRDVGGDGYIENFLLGRTARGSLTHENIATRGYRYIEALDPQDGRRYRYTGRIEEPWQTDKHYLKGYTRFVLDKTPAPGTAPRYGVTYDDISTHEERAHWIAGSSLKVIDLQNNEVIAERIGYMMDRGQGDTSGGRSPWLFAADHACPEFPASSDGHPFKMDQTRNFVEKVLHIKQEK